MSMGNQDLDMKQNPVFPGKATMKTQENGKGEIQQNKSLKYFHCEAGAIGIGEAGNAYQSASMAAAGGGFQGVGILSSLTNLVAAFLYLRVPSVVRRLGSRKRAVLLLCSLDALTWLPIILVLAFFGRVSPLWLTVLWVINLVPGLMAGPARATWIVDLTSSHKRGKYLGVRSSITNASYLTSFYIMAYVLHLFSGEGVFIGFAVVFSVACAAGLFSLMMYTKIPDPAPITQEDNSFGFVDFLRETSKRNLGRFILYTSLFTLTVSLAVPFFSVYMLVNLHFDYIVFAIVSSSALLAKIVTMPIWGRYADKLGNLKLLTIASISIPLVPLMWLLSHSVAYLVVVQLFSGIMWAGFDLCAPNFIYQSAPPEKRLRYVLYYKTLGTLSISVGSLAAVFMFTRITPIMGSQILSLFLLSGVLCFAVVAMMLPRLREIRKTNQTYQDEPLRMPALACALVPSSGLLYRPREWQRFNRRPSIEPVTATTDVPVEAKANRGLFYRPREWRWFEQSSAITTPKAAETPAKVSASRGLFYRPREWRWYQTPQTAFASSR